MTGWKQRKGWDSETSPEWYFCQLFCC